MKIAAEERWRPPRAGDIRHGSTDLLPILIHTHATTKCRSPSVWGTLREQTDTAKHR